MTKNKALIVNISVAVFIILMLLATVLIFTLADKPIVEDNKKLALLGIQFDPFNMQATAIIGFLGGDAKELHSAVVTKDNWTQEGFWFSDAYTSYKINTKTIVEEIQSLVTDEDLVSQDGDVYSKENMNYSFRFQTRYKSIKGGQIIETDIGYIHLYELDKNNEQSTITLYNRYAETANWYSVLAVVGIILVAISLIISCIVLRDKDYV